jgi:catechol 2,3-dioxygenase-like lactoylglutathione lyase family enzyme
LIQVERVDYIRVPVTDIEKAKHFYGELLGLPRNPHLDDEDRVEYELPPRTLALRVPDVLHRRYKAYEQG